MLENLINKVLITFNKMVDFLSPSTGGSVKLEGPQKVAGILEIWSNSCDLVDNIFDTDHTVLAKSILNNLVGGQRSSLTLNLNKRQNYCILTEMFSPAGWERGNHDLYN